MAAKLPGGISGIGVSAIVIGGFLVYTGIGNVPVLDGLRMALRGQKPEPRRGGWQRREYDPNVPGSSQPIAGLSTTGSALNSAIVSGAQKYIGVPYRWAGSDPRTGMDCSGYVQRVLLDIGLRGVPRTTYTFIAWSGARTVSNPVPGDLVCWPGHMGIYAGNGEMYNALKTGTNIRKDRIWSVPAPIYRRVSTGSDERIVSV